MALPLATPWPPARSCLALRCSRWATKILGPGSHLRVSLQQRATFAFGHTAPDTELHLVVECLGGALGDDRTVPANCGRFSLRRSANEQSVGVGGATPRARHPRDAGFGRRNGACSSNNGRPSASILCPLG